MTLKLTSAVAIATHWIACSLGTSLVVLFAAVTICQRLPWRSIDASFLALGLALAGFLAMWWSDWLGVVVSLVGLGWFQLAETARNGQPTYGLLPLFLAPVVLGLCAVMTRRLARRSQL